MTWRRPSSRMRVPVTSDRLRVSGQAATTAGHATPTGDVGIVTSLRIYAQEDELRQSEVVVFLHGFLVGPAQLDLIERVAV